MRTALIPILAAAALLFAAAPAPAANPGANGRVAFQGYRSLGSVNAAGGDRRPLTTEDAAFFTPAYSPDGTRVAFASDRDGNDEIYAMGAEGNAITRLTTTSDSESAPTWSPDGRRIAYERDDGSDREIWVMNADGTGAVALTANIADESTPAWSPDGTRIAFASTRASGQFDIWTMTAEGGSALQVSSDAADENNPDWAPDGSRIVFERADTVVVVAPDGSGVSPLPLPAGGQRPVFSPDGSRIAFDEGLEIFSATASGSDVQPLTSAGSSTLVAQGPTWQPIPAPPVSGGGTPGGGSPGTPGAPSPPGSDRDGDGAVVPLDCRDDDPTILPGAFDRPGDGIDQDCRGGDAAYPLLQRRIEAFSQTFRQAGYTRFTSMAVEPVRKGDRIRLSCKGPGCRVKAKVVRVRKAAKRRSVLKALRGSKLRPGARVELRVSRVGATGLVTRWIIRAGKPPRRVGLCLAPGAKRPGACTG